MGCAASAPVVREDVVVDVHRDEREIKSHEDNHPASHSFRDRVLVKLLSNRHSADSSSLEKAVHAVKKEALEAGEVEFGKNGNTEHAEKREMPDGDVLHSEASPEDNAVFGKGKGDDHEKDRTSAGNVSQRSKVGEVKGGALDRPFRSNVKQREGPDSLDGGEGTAEGPSKKRKGETGDEKKEELKAKGSWGKESKPKGDLKFEQSNLSRIRARHTKDGSVLKSRLVRSASGGGLMKTIGDITAVLSGPPISNPAIEDERGKAKARGGRIEILAFEIANVIVRVLNLRNSLQPDDIEDLRKQVLNSEGVRQLVSEDELDLWCIAAEDKRMELRAVAKEVARLGLLCSDPVMKSLDHDFNMLGTVEEPKLKLTEDDIEVELKNMECHAQATAELYHELIGLKSLEQLYQRKLQGEEKSDDREEKKGSGSQKDPFASLKSDLKGREKSVKTLKKKSLWTKRLDWVVGKLVEVIIFLHQQIVQVFGQQVVKVGGLMDRPRESPSDLQKLGVSGLAVHYANVINVIDNLAMRPFAAAQLRDTLYSMLTPSLKRKLKRALLKSGSMAQEDTDTLVERMESVLDWLVTMGANTVRYAAERRLQGHTELTLLQSLHHANQDRTEALIVSLLVSLNHVASRHRRQGEPERSPIPHAPIIAPIPEEKNVEIVEVVETVTSVAGPTLGGVGPPGRLADLFPEIQGEKDDDDEDDDLGEEWKIRESGGDGNRGVADHYFIFGSEEKNVFLSPISHLVPPKQLQELPIPRSISRRGSNLAKDGLPEIDLSSLPSPRGPFQDARHDETPVDSPKSSDVPRTPPSIVAYRKVLASLPEEDRIKIDLASESKEAPPGISKSLEFVRNPSGGLTGKLNGKTLSGGLPKSPLAHEPNFLSPRSHSFSSSRSLSRSNSGAPYLSGDETPRQSRVRAMTPPAVDVDALGDSSIDLPD